MKTQVKYDIAHSTWNGSENQTSLINMKASTLAVGTELTSGQITNANAAWISARLKNMGIVTAIHMTVPDDRELIRQSLELCASKSDLIFVTGGLGPTSDDFTRDLVTEWAGQSLEFDETSWKKVQDRLLSRGIPVHEFQKQQCYFPKGSQILNNSQGTANAFYIQGPQHLWALPGPPREVEAVWVEHISDQIKSLTKNLDTHHTQSWDTLGLGENQVAKIVEPLVINSGLEVGYRVHLPYVEVKLSYFRSQQDQIQKYINSVDQALSSVTASRDGIDAAQTLCNSLNYISHFCIVDQATGGFLLRRLQPYLKTLLLRHGFTYTQSDKASLNEHDGLTLTCLQLDEFTCLMKLTQQSESRLEASIEAPFKSPLMLDRKKQYWAERIIIECLKHFPKS